MREFQCKKPKRILQKCTVAVHDGTAAVHDRTVAVHDGTVAVHEGTVAVHDGTVVLQDCTLAVHDGTAFRVGQHFECKTKILLLKPPHS